MTAPSHTPSVTSRAVPDDPTDEALAALPFDRREVGAVLATSVAVAAAHLADLPARVLAAAQARAVPPDALLGMSAHLAPWLLGLLCLGAAYGAGWLPRTRQRLLEPSPIAAWTTVAIAGGSAWGLTTLGVWPVTWASTRPAVASLVTSAWTQQQWLAVTLWVAVSCLVAPLVLELVFRFALLDVLRRRTGSDALAVLVTAIAFAGVWLAAGWAASPVAATRHALIAGLASVALGTLALRGTRGRGLGLCVMAHGAWMATEAWLLLRALPAGS